MLNDVVQAQNFFELKFALMHYVEIGSSPDECFNMDIVENNPDGKTGAQALDALIDNKFSGETYEDGADSYLAERIINTIVYHGQKKERARKGGQ